MKVPKYIKKKLSQRVKHAELFASLDADICNWMKKHGFDLCDPQLELHILTGAESIINPRLSAKVLIEYIENNGKIKEEK